MGFISILSLSALLLVMLADRTNGWIYRNDYTYEVEVNGWVKLHHIPQTWDNARLRCLYEGSTLASPLNYQLLAVMKKNIFDHKVKEIFTGFSATYYKGDFYSIGGISLENVHFEKRWAPGEPNNNGNENCITIDIIGSFADVSCSKVLPFMCFKMNLHRISLSLTQCGTVDPGYQYEYRIDGCYKLHRFGRSWPNAFMVCAAEGGYLTIINSDKEAQVLKELMAKYPPSVIRAQHEDRFAIGLHDWSEYGDVWRTVHGRTLKDASYNTWANGEPYDNNENRGKCGAMFRNVTLKDIDCESNVPFICEKRPRNLQDYKLDSSNEV